MPTMVPMYHAYVLLIVIVVIDLCMHGYQCMHYTHPTYVLIHPMYVRSTQLPWATV